MQQSLELEEITREHGTLGLVIRSHQRALKWLEQAEDEEEKQRAANNVADLVCALNANNVVFDGGRYMRIVK